MTHKPDNQGSSAPNGDPPASLDAAGGKGQFRSHLLPRTRDGWIAVLFFFGLFALAEPPFTHTWANRTEPWVLGFPFLYSYLLVIYTAVIVVLIWALRRRI